MVFMYQSFIVQNVLHLLHLGNVHDICLMIFSKGQISFNSSYPKLNQTMNKYSM